MYFIGTYLIGIGSATNFNNAIALNFNIFWWLLFFTIPANLFVYGVNDIADEDTDVFNIKKGTYEAKVKNSEKKIILWSGVISILVFTPLFLNVSFSEKVALVIFIVFGFIYSLPPIRLKARPFLDSLSNGVLYTMPALIGYYAAGGQKIFWLPYLAGALWASVMHLYSAIPDIEADTKAGIKTTATYFAAKRSLAICFLTYLLIGAMVYVSGYKTTAFLVLPYLILILLSFASFKKSSSVFSIYKAYPYVTYVVGALVYASVVSINNL
jgi:lycopene elongase/hydratase (dihydrobisanhydrobacterioruberin-forming)